MKIYKLGNQVWLEWNEGSETISKGFSGTELSCEIKGEMFSFVGKRTIETAFVRVSHFSEITDQTGTSYGASVEDVKLAISTIVNFSSGSTGSTTDLIEQSNPLVSTTTIGGITSGTVLTDLSVDEIFQLLFTPFQNPAFLTFSLTSPSLIEVGTTINPVTTATWSTSNSANVLANSIAIRDNTINVILAGDLANDGSEGINLGTVTNTTPITRSYRAEATNTQSVGFFSTNYIITSIYPYFYGVSTTLPTVNQALIDSGTKVVANSSGTITIDFGASGKYLWFAIPNTSTSKTKWYIDSLNNGNIGSISDLFNSPTVYNTDSTFWSNINYKIYVTNYPTTTNSAMQLRNS